MLGEESIFDQALRRATPQERKAFLDEACAGDPELRRQVESLLEAHQRAADFLKPDHDVTDPAGPPGRLPGVEVAGSVVGNYKLLEMIGEGGMGVVFMAEQLRPVRRRVAVKIIKPGLDSKQVIARLEAERQALAMMDHPNIAKVFDAGATEAGRPYFVMELVRGIPITQYSDQEQLTPRKRLELFVRVCQAVQHAHQKGIIHRDLKPNNILVTLQEGKPTPKIIDFGIAKATAGQRLTDQTLFTEFHQLVGTPLYMSPEQAEMSGLLDLDTRSDVYSLGVLLYELLTGSTPFDKQRLAKAAYDEVRRIIREEEPPRPSTRISGLGETLTKVCAQRQTDPGKLGSIIRGELDWIVMRALEKDRSRRYETANGLARDVERYLGDQPVEACPPSRVYRLRKFARRNKAVIVTAGVIAGVLLAATVVSTWQAVRARRAEAAAVAAQEEMKRRRDQAIREERRADEQAATAAGFSGFYSQINIRFNPSFEQPLRKQAEWCLEDLGTRRELALTVFAQLIDVYRGRKQPELVRQWAKRLSEVVRLELAATSHELEGAGPTDPRLKDLLFRRAQCNRSLGRFREALGDFVRLHELEPAEYFDETGTLQLYLEEVAAYRETCRQMLRQFGATTDRKLAVDTVEMCASGEGAVPDLAPLARLVDQALAQSPADPDVLLGKGMVEYRLGNDDAAVEALVRSRTKFGTLLARRENSPLASTEATANYFLAMAEHRRGNREQARRALSLARLRLQTQVPDPSNAGMEMGDPNWLMVHIAAREADGVFGPDSTPATRPAATSPASPAAETPAPRPESVTAVDEVLSMARAVRSQEKLSEAEQYYRVAISLQRRTFGERTAEVSGALIDLSRVLRDEWKIKEWKKTAGEAVEILRKSDNEERLAVALYEVGMAEGRDGRRGEAEKAFREALDIQRHVFGPNGAAVANTMKELGYVLWEQGRNEEAKPLIREAIAILQRAPPSGYRTALPSIKIGLANVLLSEGKYGEAEALLRSTYDELMVHSLPSQQRDVRTVLGPLVSAQVHQRKFEDAVSMLLEREQGLHAAGAPTTEDELQAADLLVSTYRTAGMPAQAEVWEAKRIEVLEAQIAPESKKLADSPDPGSVYFTRGGLYARVGRFREAADDLTKAIDARPEDVERWHEGVALLLQVGDEAGYLRRHGQELRRFADTKDPRTAHVVAKDSLLLPIAGEELRIAAELAERGAWRSKSDTTYVLTKGMAEYRLGHIEAAMPWLEKAKADPAYFGVQSRFFMAMAFQRLGRPREAREALADAQREMRARLPVPGKSLLAGGPWNMAQDWVLCQFLSREAEELVSGRGPTTQEGSSGSEHVSQ